MSLSFLLSLLGNNASGDQKAGKKKRRKRNRKKKTKTSSNNNGTEAKKTAPTPAAASATSAPAAANKLGAIVGVVSKIHKNFGKDKIASVAAKLAKKGKGVNAKDVVSALKTTVCDFCTLFYRRPMTPFQTIGLDFSPHFHFLLFPFLFFSFSFMFPCYMVS